MRMFNKSRIGWLVASFVITGLLLFYVDDKGLVRNSTAAKECHCGEPTQIEDWKVIRAKDMSAEQVFRYLKWSNSSSCQLTFDFGGQVIGLFNRWGIDGQKAVCMDPNVAPVSGSCLIYSVGINNEWSFDKQFDNFGCHVCAFDPSMNMTTGNYSARIHYFHFGLASRNEQRGDWIVLTLDTIYNKLKANHGPNAIDYLKIDIEREEWTTLPQILHSGMMDNVKQLGVEFHFNPHDSLDKFLEKIEVIQSLEDYGMIRFASRVNMWMRGHMEIVDRIEHHAYEIAWYNSKFL